MSILANIQLADPVAAPSVVLQLDSGHVTSYLPLWDGSRYGAESDRMHRSEEFEIVERRAAAGQRRARGSMSVYRGDRCSHRTVVLAYVCICGQLRQLWRGYASRHDRGGLMKRGYHESFVHCWYFWVGKLLRCVYY